MAVHRDVEYVVVESDFTGSTERYLLAEARLPAYARELGDGRGERIVAPAARAPTWSGCATRRRSATSPGTRESHVVLHADYVTTEDGTGVVHIAPALR